LLLATSVMLRSARANRRSNYHEGCCRDQQTRNEDFCRRLKHDYAAAPDTLYCQYSPQPSASQVRFCYP
jgi:hypothetical protein